MDDNKLRQALATLRAFADNLPKGHTIEEKYVFLYHDVLTDIEAATGHELDYFRVPDTELTIRESGGAMGYDGSWEQYYTNHRQCDIAMFLIKFNGAVNFIASFLDAPGKRIIGFSS